MAHPARPPALRLLNLRLPGVRLPRRLLLCPLLVGALASSACGTGRDTPAGAPAQEETLLPPTPTTTVRRVFPAADAWPVNLRRLHLEFTSTMDRSTALTHLHLLDRHGTAVPEAFLRPGADAWNVDRTRLTVPVNPAARLTPGDTYTLVVDAAWPDAQGQPLRASYRRAVRATAADTTAIDLGAWTIEHPGAGSSDAVVVRFGEAMDRQSLMATVGLAGADGRPLEVDTVIEGGDHAIRFAPEDAWAPGDYRLMVRADLEDLGGNTVAKTAAHTAAITGANTGAHAVTAQAPPAGAAAPAWLWRPVTIR